MRLRNFLLSNEMPEYLDKKEIYSSKLMSYYRRMLKVESRNELFMEPMPSKENWWDPANSADLFENNSNNSNYGNNLFNNNNYNNNNSFGNSSFNNHNTGYNNSSKSEMFNFNENSIPDYSKTSKYSYINNDNNYNNDYSNNNNSFPKSEIIISDDHYQQSRNNIHSSYSNSSPSEPKFANIDPKYKNDSRFASIGSEPVDSYSTYNPSNSYMSTVGNVLGTIWNTSVNAASVVKDKMNEYEIGSKLMFVGGKAIEAITYTGSKVIEKGTEIAQSETMHNIVAKAGEGIGNLKEKITGKKGGNYSYGSSYYGNSDRLNGDYSSRGSDDY